jgi:hypothetical protein
MREPREGKARRFQQPDALSPIPVSFDIHARLVEHGRSSDYLRGPTMRSRIILLLCCVLAAPALAQKPAGRITALLPWSQQLAVREQWLVKRHEMILPMMRAHGIDMWIVVNEEFHDDPLTQYIAPPRPYAGGRDYFVFVDTGDKGLRKIAITGFSEENLKKFFESLDEPRPADKVLPELYEQYKPKKIALSYGARRGVQRSITYDTYNLIAEKMGSDAAQHFVPAADLIEDYLDTRIPEEFATYTAMVQLTDSLTRRALSSEVIRPGKTTVGDVRRWLYDQLWENRVGTWFQPDLRVQRKARRTTRHADSWRSVRGKPSSSAATWCTSTRHQYMGLNTDWQKMAYVLLPARKDAPAN